MATKNHINLIFIGHVDHGKSTTVGRLLYDAGALSEQEYRKLEENKFLQYYYIGGWDFMFRYCWKRQMENQRDSEVWKTYREHCREIRN